MRTMTREDAIADIRREILKLVDDDHSMCEVAGRLGILCRGFRQFSDRELETRYKWLVERRGVKTRPELEVLANRWQLARQMVLDKALSCDAQLEDRDMCQGWDTFNNATLARFHQTLCGELVTVTGERTGPVPA